MNNLTIRQATRSDADLLVEMRRNFILEELRSEQPYGIAEERPGFVEDCQAFLVTAILSESWRVWVAEIDGRIIAHLLIGYLDKVPSPLRPNQRIGYVTDVYTRPEFRNRGIGERLLRRAQEDARRSDVDLMVVWPSKKSPSFYRRGGFDDHSHPLVWKAR